MFATVKNVIDFFLILHSEKAIYSKVYSKHVQILCKHAFEIAMKMLLNKCVTFIYRYFISFSLCLYVKYLKHGNSVLNILKHGVNFIESKLKRKKFDDEIMIGLKNVTMSSKLIMSTHFFKFCIIFFEHINTIPNMCKPCPKSNEILFLFSDDFLESPIRGIQNLQ